MSGGNNGGLEAYLPMALAIGATVATGGAAAPAIGTMLGAEAGTLGAAALGAGAMGAGSSALGGIMQGKSAGDILKNSLLSGTVGAATAGALGGTGGQYVGEMPTDAMGSLPTDAAASNVIPAGGVDSAQSIVDNMKPTIYSGDGAMNLDGTAYQPPSNLDTAKNYLSRPYDELQATKYQKYAPGLAATVASGMFQPGNGIVPIAGQGVPKGLQFHFNEDPNAMYQPSFAPNYNGIAGINNGIAAQRPIGYGYADGGTVEQMSMNNTNNTNQSFPQSGAGGLNGNNRYQSSMVAPTDTATDAYTGAMKFAVGGGIASYAGGGDLGSYSDGGRMLKGPGDGMSDSIPAKIGHRQPARLADSEFVIPADVVSHLGNGSSDAGAKQLYAMMDRVRKARTGRKAQGKQIKAEKYLPV
jgi:hypothetical protein